MTETTSRWMRQTSSAKVIIVVMALLSLFSGVMQTLVLKWQNRMRVLSCTADPITGIAACKEKYFHQAFLQTFVMFLGECLAIPFILLSNKNPNALQYDQELYAEQLHQDEQHPQSNVNDTSREIETHGARREAPLWWWMTPAPLDFCECALGCVAVTITYASTVQMLHNFMVICSAVFTILILRYPLKVHEWMGSIVVTIALVLCGIPALRNPEEATEVHQDYQWLGILLALVSTCVHSLQNIWEEALFRKCDVDATVAIGVEGITGAILSGAALPIVEWVGYESTSEGLHQLVDSPKLRWGCVLFGVSSLLNNLCGIAVTKWANGLLRCLFMSLRPPMVWLCEMYLSWNKFDWYNFASMFVLAAGLFIYMLLPPLDRLGGAGLLSPVTFGLKSWWREQPTVKPPFQERPIELSQHDEPLYGATEARDGIAYGGPKDTPMTATPVV